MTPSASTVDPPSGTPPTAFDGVLADVAATLRGNDAGFFRRVWDGGLAPYRARLAAIGFEHCTRVLDAGCGFGQWTCALAQANARVDAVDVDPVRTDATRRLAAACAPDSDVQVREAGVTALPYPDATFDAVFAYGVVFIPDARAALAEFARVLAPGGRLYLSANGLGWSLRGIIEAPNAAPDYDPRALAAASIAATLEYLTTGARVPDTQLVIEPGVMRRWLAEAGFGAIRTGGEGTLTVDGRPAGPAFFPAEYAGHACVYDVLATKEPA